MSTRLISILVAAALAVAILLAVFNRESDVPSASLPASPPPPAMNSPAAVPVGIEPGFGKEMSGPANVAPESSAAGSLADQLTGPGALGAGIPGTAPEAGSTGVMGLAPEAGAVEFDYGAPEAGQPINPGPAPESSDPGTPGPAPEDS